MAHTGRAKRVAVVGGGCAAVAAAFELSRPEHRRRFEITIYQMGWRLGGKGASGRGQAGRIEEHGLHLWLGFYDNAFRLLRECYDELAGDPAGFAVADWREAFFPESNIGLLLESGPQTWLSWSACFPPHPGLPGDDIDPAEQFSLVGYLRRAIALLRTLIFGVEVTRRGETAGELHD
ncbi:MAG: NAD(P)-binding protein, partial [Alphaproteobacteria bacterium]|nr:NAD(P)-binding protein [Alphaproteobacteria bacterium]